MPRPKSKLWFAPLEQSVNAPLVVFVVGAPKRGSQRKSQRELSAAHHADLRQISKETIAKHSAKYVVCIPKQIDISVHRSDK
jgi:hypothetical protein